jgi:hypothetical protein
MALNYINFIIFTPQSKITGNRRQKISITKNYTICILRCHWGDQEGRRESGWACGTHRRDKSTDFSVIKPKRKKPNC